MPESDRVNMKAGPIGILRNRNFRKLFVAGITSTSGRTIASASLVWLIFQQTGSSLDLAYFGITGTIAAIVFSLLAGSAVDRYNRRKLMILSDSVRGIALMLLVAVLVINGFNFIVILLVSFVVSAFSTVFGPSEYALIPEIVDSSIVSDANGLVRSSRSITGFVGNAVAGVLIVTVGAIAGLAYNSATFFVSAVFVALISANVGRVKQRISGTVTKRSYFKDLAEGFQWLKQNKGLLELTISALILNFFFTMGFGYVVVFSTTALHQSGLIYGVILALFSVGDALGALLVGRVNAVRFAGKAWTLPYGVGGGLLFLVMSLFVNVYVALFSALAIGIFVGFSGTSWLSAAQILVPSEMQGRYFGIDNLGSYAIIPVAQISGALLISSIGITETLPECDFSQRACLSYSCAIFFCSRPIRLLNLHNR